MKILKVGRLRTEILSDSIQNIGKFKTVKRLGNFNADKKRLWFQDLRDVNDCKIINSIPLSLNWYNKKLKMDQIDDPIGSKTKVNRQTLPANPNLLQYPDSV